MSTFNHKTNMSFRSRNNSIGSIGRYNILFEIIFAPIIETLQNLFNRKYIHFINNHSTAVKKIKDINSRYNFASVQSYEMRNDYDNDAFYDEIDPEDYLIYQLVYHSKELIQNIKNAENNLKLYNDYIAEVKAAKNWNSFDSEEKPKNLKRLERIEKRVFNQLVKEAYVNFTIEVMLIQTNINDVYLTHKAKIFDKDEVKILIKRIQNKNGDFYFDRGIWDAICRIERGKVSNKMRFAIYERDGYRCVRCGQSNGDLEIDHIFPISKGGKSNFDNLQTLCHRCNSLKSNTIVEGAINPRLAKKANPHSSTPVCPNCNIPMVLRKGTYGEFYGCRNYPNCKHTEHI